MQSRTRNCLILFLKSEKLNNYRTNRIIGQITIAIFFVGIYFLLEPIILNFLFSHWKDHIIKTSLFYKTVSVILFLLFTIIYTLKKKTAINSIDITAGLIYLIIRGRENIDYFPLFDKIEPLKLIDVFALIYSIAAFIKLICSIEDESEKKPEYGVFTPDLSLNDISKISGKSLNELDSLSVYQQAESLADNIAKVKPKKSFVIGINGKWGYGKTSFYHMIKEKLDKKDNIVTLELSSWLNDEKQDINHEFLIKLGNIFSPLDSGIKISLENYNRLLEKAEGKLFGVSFLSNLIREDESLNDSRDLIVEKLRDYKKTIVVFIDDLDRLTHDEVFKVIKLVRVIGEFPNLIFILPYDKEYVEKAIEQHLSGKNTKNYLEKIVNVEYKLPDFIQEEFLTVIIISIVEKIGNLINDELEKNKLKAELNARRADLYRFISNLRDEKKLFNNLALTLPAIVEEVDIEIFIWLELIKMKAPKTYSQLKKLFTYSDFKKIDFPIVKFRTPIEGGTEDIINKNLNIETDEQDIYNESLKNLIIYILNKESQYPVKSNIDKYFSYRVKSNQISKKEFNDYQNISVNGDAKNEKLKNWLSNKAVNSDTNKFISLLDHLYYSINLSNPQFRKVLESIKDEEVLKAKTLELFQIITLQFEYLKRNDWKDNVMIDINRIYFMMHHNNIYQSILNCLFDLFSLSQNEQKHKIYNELIKGFKLHVEFNWFLKDLEEINILPYKVEPDYEHYNTEELKIINTQHADPEIRYSLKALKDEKWVLLEEGQDELIVRLVTKPFYRGNQHVKTVLTIISYGGSLTTNISSKNHIPPELPVLTMFDFYPNDFYNEVIELTFKKSHDPFNSLSLPLKDNIEYPKSPGFIFSFRIYYDYEELLKTS